jgi:Fe-S-cluster containining protein
MQPWYGDGLRFACTGCGDCCTGAAGYTWVSRGDIACLASHLGLALDEFGRSHLRRVGERHALLEDRQTGACVFLEHRSCSVYAARPAQCRAYPFWPRNLTSREAWAAASRECEGIRDDAPRMRPRAVGDRG